MRKLCLFVHNHPKSFIVILLTAINTKDVPIPVRASGELSLFQHLPFNSCFIITTNCFLPPLFPLSFSLVELTEDILKQLMDLVFTLVCNGELSLARVLRKNILDKVEQKKLLRYTNSLKPLAARGVSARYCWGPGSGSSDTRMGIYNNTFLHF